MPLYRVRMELARTPEHPAGSPLHGYEFVAPLDDKGHLDAEEWRAHKTACTVRRFWEGAGDENGHLRHVGRGWHFHYEGDVEDDDDPLFKLDRHAVILGDYLSVTEDDEGLQPFKIVHLEKLT